MLEEYSDFVEFSCETGRFRVPLSARLATLSLSTVPKQHLHFGLCPTNEFLEQPFTLVNDGQVTANFVFKTEAPFSVTPRQGWFFFFSSFYWLNVVSDWCMWWRL